MRRISLSLDDDTYKIVEKLKNDTKSSMADVFRMLIRYYFEQDKIFKKVDTETIVIYLDYLQKKEHIMLDIDLLCAIFEELGKKNSRDLWELVRQSGKAHGKQYLKKGMKNLKDILYYVEKSNLFGLKIESLDYCTLVLVSPSVKKFLRTFLEGVFEAQGMKVEITESWNKLSIQHFK